MKKIRESNDDIVFDELEKTYPDYSLCSLVNLGRMSGRFKITNESRFWNERCDDFLKPLHDFNQTFQYFPDSYKAKLLFSREIDVMFFSGIFPYLTDKIKDAKNPDPKDIAMMIRLCSKFLTIGLTGILQTMPSSFIHILEPKVQEVFTLMEGITQYTKQIAPSYAKSIEFPYDMYEKSVKKQEKKHKQIPKVTRK